MPQKRRAKNNRKLATHCVMMRVLSIADPNDLHIILGQSQLSKKQALDVVKNFLSGEILNV